MKNCWFDGDYSEAFYGRGHIASSEFRHWVFDYLKREGVSSLEAAACANENSVRHMWARWTDDEPHERFQFCSRWMRGAFPITVLRP